METLYKRPEKVQRQGYWEWIVTRYCADGHPMRLCAGRTVLFGHRRGPSLPPGGTYCSCGLQVNFAYDGGRRDHA